MAERNKVTQAIVLTLHDHAEQNKLVRFFSPDFGIFYAVLYGGAKSKMRSLVQQFNVGTLYFYADERHNSRKITDFDVSLCPETFCKSLYKLWAANMAAELLCKTECAGDSKAAFDLFKAYIWGLNASNQNEARLGTLRFLWRYLTLLGLEPDVTSCASCDTPLAQNKDAFYLPIISGFVCKNCLEEIKTADMFPLKKEGLDYLKAIQVLPPKDTRNLPIEQTTSWQLKSLLFYLIEQAAGSPLQTLKSGTGIL